jgi:hypothetical protein
MVTIILTIVIVAILATIVGDVVEIEKQVKGRTNKDMRLVTILVRLVIIFLKCKLIIICIKLM